MNLNIRYARLDDLDNVVEIESICFPPAEAATRESLEERLKGYGESFLVGELDGKPVGFVNGSVINEKTIRDEFYESICWHNPQGDYQSIFGLVVLPEYRNHGVAAKLILSLIETARKSGRKGVTLCCKEEKIAYYAKFGFENLGKSKSEHGNAIWYDMVLPLNQ